MCISQANCGDSRAVTSVGGTLQELSHDHKPTNEGTSLFLVLAKRNSKMDSFWTKFLSIQTLLSISVASLSLSWIRKLVKFCKDAKHF